MTALKAAQVDAFVAKPNPAQPVVLVYGADAGLVRERAEALVRVSVDDLNDPFSLVRLEGDLRRVGAVAAGRGGQHDSAVRRQARGLGESRRAQLRAGGRDPARRRAEGMPRRDRGRRAAQERAAARRLREGEERRRARLLSRQREGSAAADRCRDAGGGPDHRAGGARRAGAAARRRPPGLAQRAAEARALCPRQAAGRDRGRRRGGDRCVGAGARCAGRRHLRRQACRRRVPVHQGAQRRHLGRARSCSAVARHASLLHKARLAVDDGQSVDSAVGGLWLHFSRVPLAQAALRAWPAASPANRDRARSPTRRCSRASTPISPKRSCSGCCCRWRWRQDGRRSPDGAKRNPGRPPRIALRSMRATSRRARLTKFHVGSMCDSATPAILRQPSPACIIAMESTNTSPIADAPTTRPCLAGLKCDVIHMATPDPLHLVSCAPNNRRSATDRTRRERSALPEDAPLTAPRVNKLLMPLANALKNRNRRRARSSRREGASGNGATGASMSKCDFARHVDYIHFNPVKHGLICASPIEAAQRAVHQ